MNTFLNDNRGNLNFLLNTSDRSFQNWANKMEEDDLFYALFLLKTHLLFVKNRLDIINEERKINKCAEMNNYFYANNIVDKIKENLK